MSKILKFIVNLFLIGAILVAVAILVPPLAGITTTVVDTPSMNTNLPLGSITYSTDIDVYDIKPGDEILKENDTSTYAYVIRETDPANGVFKAVSAADLNGAEEEVKLRNTVSKVAVVVPYIGYIMIAMHSIEGIIIVVLVVVLMIILFILSELWKVRPGDEEEEDETDEMNREEIPQVTAREETDIDTDAIRAAVQENHSAAAYEEETPSGTDTAFAVDEEPDYSGMSWSEKRAAKKARKMAERAAREAAHSAGDAIETAIAGGTAAAGAAIAPTAAALEEAKIEEALAELTPLGQKEEHEITASPEDFPTQPLPGTEKAPEQDSFIPDVPFDSGLTADFGREDTPVPAESGQGQTLEELAREMEERAKENGTDGGYLPTEEKEDFYADFPDAEELAAREAASGSTQMSAEDLVNAERFAPTPRPTLEEILEQAKDTGKDPVIKKDERSGVSFVDVSGLL